jgi:hypothetical protein
MGISKLIVYTEGRVPDGCSCIKRYIRGSFILQTRSWQDSIQQPLRPIFQRTPAAGSTGILPFYIDAHARTSCRLGL